MCDEIELLFRFVGQRHLPSSLLQDRWQPQLALDIQLPPQGCLGILIDDEKKRLLADSHIFEVARVVSQHGLIRGALGLIINV